MGIPACVYYPAGALTSFPYERLRLSLKWNGMVARVQDGLKRSLRNRRRFPTANTTTWPIATQAILRFRQGGFIRTRADYEDEDIHAYGVAGSITDGYMES